MVRPDYDLYSCTTSGTLKSRVWLSPLIVSTWTSSTIPGATIRELSYAWRLDYHKEPRPQRVMAGLNDLIKCGGTDQFKEQEYRL